MAICHMQWVIIIRCAVMVDVMLSALFYLSVNQGFVSRFMKMLQQSRMLSQRLQRHVKRSLPNLPYKSKIIKISYHNSKHKKKNFITSYPQITANRLHWGYI